MAVDRLSDSGMTSGFEGATATYGTRPDIAAAAAARGFDHEFDVGVPR